MTLTTMALQQQRTCTCYVDRMCRQTTWRGTRAVPRQIISSVLSSARSGCSRAYTCLPHSSRFWTSRGSHKYNRWIEETAEGSETCSYSTLRTASRFSSRRLPTALRNPRFSANMARRPFLGRGSGRSSSSSRSHGDAGYEGLSGAASPHRLSKAFEKHRKRRVLIDIGLGVVLVILGAGIIGIMIMNPGITANPISKAVGIAGNLLAAKLHCSSLALKPASIAAGVGLNKLLKKGTGISLPPTEFTVLEELAGAFLNRDRVDQLDEQLSRAGFSSSMFKTPNAGFFSSPRSNCYEFSRTGRSAGLYSSFLSDLSNADELSRHHQSSTLFPLMSSYIYPLGRQGAPYALAESTTFDVPGLTGLTGGRTHRESDSD